MELNMSVHFQHLFLDWLAELSVPKFPHHSQGGTRLVDQSPGEPCLHHQQSARTSTILQQNSCCSTSLTGLAPIAWSWVSDLSEVHFYTQPFSGRDFVPTESHNAWAKSSWLDQIRWNKWNWPEGSKQWEVCMISCVPILYFAPVLKTQRGGRA